MKDNKHYKQGYADGVFELKVKLTQQLKKVLKEEQDIQKTIDSQNDNFCDIERHDGWIECLKMVLYHLHKNDINNKPNQDSNGKNIPTNFDLEESLECVWNALSGYRKGCISGDDEQWDDVCTAMAWIEESLNEDENDTLAWENKNFAEYLENVLGYDLDLVSQVANGNIKGGVK